MKQAIIVRKDLKMSCGKIAGQVAHASVRAYRASDQIDRILWFTSGEAKIVLKVNSEEELKKITEKCKTNKIICEEVRDAGRTQIEPHTLTAVGIGPDSLEKIDKITGGLKLL